MIQLYLSQGPNPVKVALMLDERPAIRRVGMVMQGSEAKSVIDDEARRALYAFQFTEPKG